MKYPLNYVYMYHFHRFLSIFFKIKFAFTCLALYMYERCNFISPPFQQLISSTTGGTGGAAVISQEHDQRNLGSCFE